MKRAVVVNIRSDVYVGRAGKGMDGLFGNPYRIGEKCKRCGKLHSTAGETLPCFEAYFLERMASDWTFRAAVGNLAGKTSGASASQESAMATSSPSGLISLKRRSMDEVERIEHFRYVEETCAKAVRAVRAAGESFWDGGTHDGNWLLNRALREHCDVYGCVTTFGYNLYCGISYVFHGHDHASFFHGDMEAAEFQVGRKIGQRIRKIAKGEST